MDRGHARFTDELGHIVRVETGAGHHLDPVYVELLCNNIDKALAINERFPD